MIDYAPIQKRIADHLGIDPYPISFEEMDQDSYIIFKEERVVINSKYKDNYLECAKCIAHEYRHAFQFFRYSLFNDEIAVRWKKAAEEMTNDYKNFEDYISQELEIDAFAFTKYYFKECEGIDIKNNIEGLDPYLDLYIQKYHTNM